MSAATISIDVDPETARFFSKASEEERRKLQLLLKARLRDLTVTPSRSLTQIMDEIGQEAEACGLTPEILESLVHGE